MVENVENSRQKWCNKCQCEGKKLIKHRVCKDDHAQNPSTCACECHKNCKFGEYLKDCEFMKSLADDIVVKCDENVDTQQSTVINPNNRIGY